MQYLGELYENATRKVEALRDVVVSAPEGEVLVRQATNDEKWGPSGTLMLQIADMTHQFQHLPYISQTIWDRLSERRDGHNWRTVYKGLLLLDYILKNGSEQFVNEARQHSSVVNQLQRFDYIDTEGVDRGISVRERAKIVYELIHDTKALREARKTAKVNRGKFSTSISSNSASTGHYGGFGSDSYSRGGGGGGRSLRRAGEFGDDSDDDLDAGTRNKTVNAKHKAPDTVGDDWASFGSTGSQASKSKSNDDDWADFTGSKSATTAAAPAPAPVQQQPPKTIDLLSGLNLGAPAPAPAPVNNNVFSPFPAAPATSTPTYNQPAGVGLFATPAPAPVQTQPQPTPIISLLDSPAKSSFSTAPAPNATAAKPGNNKDLFDFGVLSSTPSASKPLAATVTPTAAPSPAAQPAFGAYTAPVAAAPAAYPAPVYGQPGYPAAYPVAYGQPGYPQPAVYAYPPGYAAQPPPGY